MSKIYKKIFVVIFALMLIPFVTEAEGIDLDEFLYDCTQTKIEKFLEAMRSDEHGNIFALTDDNGNVFSLALVPLMKDPDIDVALELEKISMEYASMKAENNLALHIGENMTDKISYRYDEPLGSALLVYYERRISKIENSSDIVNFNNKVFAAAIAWLSSDYVKQLKNDIPAKGTLDDDYCKYLYFRKAKKLFAAGNFDEALPLFKNIHDLKWANVEAYTDVAECFLHTGKPNDCVKVLKELITTLHEKMTSKDFIRVGRIFRSADDRESALRAFQEAKKLYRQGR